MSQPAPLTDEQPDEVRRLHDVILERDAEIAKLRDLLGKENERANAAIDREETAEQAALEAQQERDAAAPFTDSERTMLRYALDEAQEHIWSRDGFTDEDQAAVDSLRARLEASSASARPVPAPEAPDGPGSAQTAAGGRTDAATGTDRGEQ